MRTRQLGPVYESHLSSVFVHPQSDPVYLYGTFPWDHIASHEVISDDPVKRRFAVGDRRVLAYKAVEHSRYSIDCSSGDVTWRTGPTTVVDTNATAVYLYEYLLGGVRPVYGSTWSDVDAGDLPSLFYEQWEKCKPSLNTRANLAVFLYELRDIKRMFELLPKKHFSMTSWRDVLNYANSQHLNYNFGWKPFLSDCKNVFKGLSTLDERMSRFLREETKLLSRRWKLDSSQSHETTGSWSIYRVSTKTEYSIRNASTFMYTYEIPDYGARELRVRAILDTLGLKVNLSNVWAILPWSFVVDWFFDVGSVLDQSSSDWIQPWINLIQGCYSYRIEGTVTQTLSNVTYGGSATIGVMTFRKFCRTPGMPYFSAHTDPLNADKIRLLASLGASLIL